MKCAQTLFFSVFMIMSQLALSDALWIDVRSQGEYQSDHIEGHPLIPHTKINQLIDQYSENKKQTIYLYCAAGIRAEMARKELLKQGYENVINVGGISDARQLISEKSQ